MHKRIINVLKYHQKFQLLDQFYQLPYIKYKKYLFPQIVIEWRQSSNKVRSINPKGESILIEKYKIQFNSYQTNYISKATSLSRIITPFHIFTRSIELKNPIIKASLLQQKFEQLTFQELQSFSKKAKQQNLKRIQLLRQFTNKYGLPMVDRNQDPFKMYKRMNFINSSTQAMQSFKNLSPEQISFYKQEALTQNQMQKLLNFIAQRNITKTQLQNIEHVCKKVNIQLQIQSLQNRKQKQYLLSIKQQKIEQEDKHDN